MFDSIVIKYNKRYHSLGNLIECMLFYDEVNLIIDKIEDLPSLWSQAGIDSLIRLKDYGLHLYMSTNTIGCGDITGKCEDIYYFHLDGESMRHRICEKAVKDFYGLEVLDNDKQMIVQQYYEESDDFTYSEEVRDAVHNDIYRHFLHKEILQAQLKEINSSISMYDPSQKYEYRQVSNGFIFDTNLRTGELEEKAKQQGYTDMRFKHAPFIIKLNEVYGIMELAAQKNSSLSVSPAESIIISCKQKSILSQYVNEASLIANFERLEVSQFSNIAEVVDSGEKSFAEILNLLDKAKEFKKWKSSLPNESDFLVEYHNALKSNLPLVQRLPVKWLRYLITTGLGMIPVAGLIAGPAATGLDTFLVDKWKVGEWKPAQFVNGELKKFVLMQQSSE